MKFNGGKFNLDGFDRDASAQAVLYADVKSKVSGTAALTAVLSLHSAVNSSFDGTAKPALSVPIEGAVLATSMVHAKAGLSVPIHASVTSTFGGIEPFLRLTAFTVIDLSGLVLLPGETLRIDTDTITVTKDGANAIEFWQMGSTPFLLGGGENELTYFDRDEERHARLSVTWRDRWI